MSQHRPETAVDDSEALVMYRRPIGEHLDDLEEERRYLIKRLRSIDDQLMRFGRLIKPTIPERAR